MIPSDQAVVQALRSDLALQITRHVGRSGRTQAAAAQRLGIPQPTMSKIMRGQVEAVSLELMLKIAMRAGLCVVLQTGKDAAEAGAYVSAVARANHVRIRSRLGEEARQALEESIRSLSPAQRLAAHLEHSQLVAALQRNATGRRSARARRSR